MLAFNKHQRLFLLDGMPETYKLYCTIGDALSDNYFHESEHSDWLERIPTPYRPQKHMFDKERDGWTLWSGKGRMWWDDPSNVDNDYWFPVKYRNAVDAARAKRFTR